MQRRTGIPQTVIKDKVCKWCKASYTPKSTIGRYCSPICHRAAHPQRSTAPKRFAGSARKAFSLRAKTTCAACGATFTSFTGLAKQKTCSALCRQVIARQKIARSAKQIVRVQCKTCHGIFERNGAAKKSRSCEPCTAQALRQRLAEQQQTAREKAPAVRRKVKHSKTTSAHIRACVKYKEAYLRKYDFLSCEVCRVSQAFKFEVHHIYYASKFPRHPQLHNERNLILICSDCHARFHADQLAVVFRQLEADRGLKELFAVTGG